MRVAFLIRRDNHYRLLGPAIDRALARGWDVECWHAVDEGLKGARALERRQAGPAFRSGRPRLREFRVDEMELVHFGEADDDAAAAQRRRHRRVVHRRGRPAARLGEHAQRVGGHGAPVLRVDSDRVERRGAIAVHELADVERVLQAQPARAAVARDAARAVHRDHDVGGDLRDEPG